MKRMLLLVTCLFMVSSLGFAAPSVDGNTITWPDDGWYQVQSVSSNSEPEQVCGGTRECQVPAGEYIVINHTTGERFEGIIVADEPVADEPVADEPVADEPVADEPAQSVVTVSGNRISWPNNGWYQVQSVTGSEPAEVCGGTAFCEVANGRYIVINHTTGERFENILVDAQPSGSEIVVDGNTISWANNGWYQVQTFGTEPTQVCGGGAFCDVPDGRYIVINHTTGERFAPVIVNTNTSSEPAPDLLPIIREETWVNILRNVVTLINTDQADERHSQILSRFNSVSSAAARDTLFSDNSGMSSLNLTMLPLADPDRRLIVDYSCDAGGELNLILNPGANIIDASASNCAIGADVYDGKFFHNGVGREGFFSSINSMEVSLSDSTNYSISGTLSTSVDRVGIRLSKAWRDLSMSEQTGDQNYAVRAFTMTRDSAKGLVLGEGFRTLTYSDGTVATDVRLYSHKSSVTGSFNVSSPWTQNLEMQVTVDLSLGGDYQVTDTARDMPAPYQSNNGFVYPANDLTSLPSQWESGSIIVRAADGSSLALRANPDDNLSALVDVDGIDSAQMVQLIDGFQVRCYALSSSFPGCQAVP